MHALRTTSPATCNSARCCIPKTIADVWVCSGRTAARFRTTTTSSPASDPIKMCQKSSVSSQNMTLPVCWRYSLGRVRSSGRVALWALRAYVSETIYAYRKDIIKRETEFYRSKQFLCISRARTRI